MNDFVEDCKRKLYGILARKAKGIVKVTYNDQKRAMYIKIVQAFGFTHKIDDPEDVFMNVTVDEVADDVMRRYKRYILDQFIDAEEK